MDLANPIEVIDFNESYLSVVCKDAMSKKQIKSFRWSHGDKQACQKFWVTQKEPTFLPEEIDGRYLFAQATAPYPNKENEQEKMPSLGTIVQVSSVKEGLQRSIYHHRLPFTAFYEVGIVWEDGTKQPIDLVI